VHSFDLVFHETVKGEPLGPRIAKIYINTSSSDEEGHICITPDCVSMREFEGQIDRLKQELDMIGKKAKQKFAEKGKI
jgi:hypothetical protein